MSSDRRAEIAVARRDWKPDHLCKYLESHGAEGHGVDVSDIGGHRFTATLLPRHVGRKCGQTLITPLIYGNIGGEVVIVAPKGGADHAPAWDRNVREGPEVAFQIAQTFRATIREPERQDRAPVWDFIAGVFPTYRKYPASTDRETPLVMLSPIKLIDIFKA